MSSNNKHYDYELIGFLAFVVVFITQLIIGYFSKDSYIIVILMMLTFILYGIYYLVGTRLYFKHLHVLKKKGKNGTYISKKNLSDEELNELKYKNLKIGLSYIILGILLFTIYSFIQFCI